ncbi:MAG: preprotein translocase subunit SecG [Pseudohongiellaceae bacterium]|jgi:preprotein translocase subunit SecG
MIEGILWVVFILVCLVICGLVLLQEGKGGGLGDAFGGAGAQTFGVKAQGVAKVTGYLVASLMVTAIVITKMRTGESSVAGQLSSGEAAVLEMPAEDAGAAAPASDPVSTDDDSDK